jgi:type IV secretory pathway TraG/TraD family ATPase VirD4
MIWWRSKKAAQADERIQIGQVSLPHWMESRHIMLSGSTGAGKTVALRRIVGQLRERGDVAVVIDAAAELMSEFGRQRDVILSPIDARSRMWEPRHEIETPADLPRLAQALIPRAPSAEGETWAGYARSLVQAALQKSDGLTELCELLFYHPTHPKDPKNPTGDSLAETLSDTAAARLFEEGAARMLASILSIISTNLGWLKFAADVQGSPWSARRWASKIDDGEASWIWLPIRADHVQMLAPYAIAVIEQVITQVLSLPPHDSRRVWLVVDELGAYPQISSLVPALTQGRKFGIRATLGMQSVSQLQASYGHVGAQTLLSCLSTKLLLRAGDSETAAWASREIGEREVRRRSETRGEHGKSENEHVAVEAAVLPSEFRNLPDRRGFLLLPGDYPAGRVQLPIPYRADGGLEPFALAPWLQKATDSKAGVGWVDDGEGFSYFEFPMFGAEDSAP